MKGLKKLVLFERRGYLRAQLTRNKKLVYLNVHREVAKAFLPNPDNLPTVNHIDGNKKNNRLENLEWANQSRQVSHAYELGLKKPPIGTKNGWSKFTNEDVSAILEMHNRGVMIKDIANQFGVNRCTISKLVNGHTYRVLCS